MRDGKTEQYLTNEGFTFSFEEDLPFTRIDMVQARDNPSRTHRRLDEDRITEMMEPMSAGVDFPAIVVIDNGEKLLTLATGLHRITAAVRVKRLRLDAYIVQEKDPFQIDVLCRTINKLEGVPPSQEERISNGLELLRLYPTANKKDIAKSVGISEHKLGLHHRAQQAEERAVSLGMGDAIRRIPAVGIKADLLVLKNNDDRFKGATHCIATTGISGTTATNFIKNIRNARTNSAADQIINTQLAARPAKKKSRRVRTPTAGATTFLSHVGHAMEIDLEKAGFRGLPIEKMPAMVALLEEMMEALPKVIHIFEECIGSIRRPMRGRGLEETAP